MKSKNVRRTKKQNKEMQILNLPSSPRSETMIEELEPEITRIQTRSIGKSEGESIPFTKEELQEP